MKYRYLLIALIAGILAGRSSTAAPADFPKYGFQIEPLEASPGDTPTQAVMMFLPPKNGFSANVNVVIQPYAGSMKDYIALSKGQFEQMKWKVVSEKSPSENEWICEYAGDLRQSSLRWYARAVLKSGKVYLVTGTSSQADWDANAPELKKCVGSFGLK